jgi:hypothetical protein
MGVCLMVIHLIAVHLTGMCLMGLYLIDVHLVARSRQVCIYLVVEALLIILSYLGSNACPGSSRQIIR